MGTVQVFKTNVETVEQAERLIRLITETFPEYTVNFDLDDCDRILRVQASGIIRESSLLTLLHTTGFDAAILADEIPPFIGNAALLSIS